MKIGTLLLLIPLMFVVNVRADEVKPRAYTYRMAGADSLHAYVFPPASPAKAGAGAILLFHGGGWNSGSAEWVFASAKRFAEWGLVAIAIDYRLAGNDVTPVDALDDVCASFEWARANAHSLGIAGKVAGYGVSAGGHLLATAATVGCGPDRRGPDAILLWSPALEVANDAWFVKMLKGDRDKALQMTPADHVTQSTPPVTIVQGASDTLTPAAGAQRFYDALKAAGVDCEINLYPNVGHLLTRNLANQEDDFDPDPEARAKAIETQRRFLERLGYIK